MSTPGQRIRARRDALGLSQWDLAKAIDRYPTSVSRWETTEVCPSGENLRRLAAALRVSPGWLLGEGPDDVPPAESAAQAPEPGDAA